MQKTTTKNTLLIAVDRCELGGVFGRVVRVHDGAQRTFSNLHNISGIVTDLFRSFGQMRTAFDLRSFGIRPQTPNIKEEILVDSQKDLTVNDELDPLAEQDDEIHGEIATFVVKVLFQQNATFQGTIQWVNEGRSLNFRSDFEMLKLIDDAIQRSLPQPKLTWD